MKAQYTTATTIKQAEHENSNKPISSLIINEHPLVITRELVEELGVRKALFFQQLHYFQSHFKKENNGISISLNSLAKEFPFFSKKTIRNYIKDLSELEYLKKEIGTDGVALYSTCIKEHDCILPKSQPLLVFKGLLKSLTIEECFILQQIHFKLNISIKEYDGKIWIKKSYAEWSHEFSFLAIRTIKNIFSKLIKNGILERKELDINTGCHTSWWTINYKTVKDLCQTSPGKQEELPSNHKKKTEISTKKLAMEKSALSYGKTCTYRVVKAALSYGKVCTTPMVKLALSSIRNKTILNNKTPTGFYIIKNKNSSACPHESASAHEDSIPRLNTQDLQNEGLILNPLTTQGEVVDELDQDITKQNNLNNSEILSTQSKHVDKMLDSDIAFQNQFDLREKQCAYEFYKTLNSNYNPGIENINDYFTVYNNFNLDHELIKSIATFFKALDCEFSWSLLVKIVDLFQANNINTFDLYTQSINTELVNKINGLF
jgi:hypothetical protein